MLVTLEGPDASGKSTLLRHLRRDLDRRFLSLYASRPPTSEDELRRELAWREQIPLDLAIVADRDPRISEPIYGRILRGRSFLREITERFEPALGLVVYCRPPLQTILENLHCEPQLAGVSEHLGAIVLAYDELMNGRASLVYDYTRGANHYVEIVAAIQHHWEQPRWTA